MVLPVKGRARTERWRSSNRRKAIGLGLQRLTTHRTRLDYIPCPFALFLSRIRSRALFPHHPLATPLSLTPQPPHLYHHLSFCCLSSHSLDTIPQNSLSLSFLCNRERLDGCCPASRSCLLSRALSKGSLTLHLRTVQPLARSSVGSDTPHLLENGPRFQAPRIRSSPCSRGIDC